MFDKYKNALHKVQLPDRTKIFISSLWMWACLMYYFTKVINVFLCFVITYTPDSLIIFNPFAIKNANNMPIIIDAYIKTKDNTEQITNKIKTLINMKWDTDIGNENCPLDDGIFKDLFGGLNVNEIVKVYPKLSTSVIWIAYLFEVDKSFSNLSDEELGKKIKYLLVNFSDKLIYRNSDLKTSEDLMFGDIPF